MTRELARREIESAVSLIAQNIDELRIVFEDAGEFAYKDDLHKVMDFLRTELEIAEKRINAALGSRAAKKAPSFSLDEPRQEPARRTSGVTPPPAPVPTPVPAEPPEIAARRARMAEIQKNGGRLSAYSPEIDPSQPTAPVFPSSGSDYVGGDIDFLDDKE